VTRPQNITLGEMRKKSASPFVDYCSAKVEISADHWPGHLRLSDLEPEFVCRACAIKGAEVRADVEWPQKQPSQEARLITGTLGPCYGDGDDPMGEARAGFADASAT
jgi:hypothetical protein